MKLSVRDIFAFLSMRDITCIPKILYNSINEFYINLCKYMSYIYTLFYFKIYLIIRHINQICHYNHVYIIYIIFFKFIMYIYIMYIFQIYITRRVHAAFAF